MHLDNLTQTRPKIVLIVCCLFHAITDASFAILPAVLPLLVREFVLSYSDVGLLYGTYLAVMVLFQPISGALADRFDELDLLAIGCFLTSVTCLSLFHARSYMEIFLFNLAYAVGFSFFHPASYAVLSRVTSESRHRTKTMGISGSAGDFGNFTAFVTTGAIAGYLGWRTPFLLWGVLALLALCIYIILLRPRKRSPSSTTDHNPSSNPENTGKGVLSRKSVVLISLLCILLGGSYRLFINFTTLFLTDVIHIPPNNAAVFFSIFVLSGVIGSFSSGYIVKKIDLKKGLTIEFLVLSVCMFLLQLSLLQTLTLVSISLIISGFVLYATYPALYSIAADITSFGGRGRTYGFVMSISFVGGTALSVIGGKLADMAANISVVYLLGAIISLCAVVVSGYLREGSNE